MFSITFFRFPLGGVCTAHAPANGTVDGCPDSQEVLVGENVTFACNNGYEFEQDQYEIMAQCATGGTYLNVPDCTRTYLYVKKFEHV